jgi:2-polyprenyl-3-methyl-5-hydroxy-6-metoxy-1,4-benzoquinol methylase
MPYDNAYRKTPDYFGAESSTFLRKFYHPIDKSKPMLDIGARQGGNSVFLARQGFAIDAIDPSLTMPVISTYHLSLAL